MEPVGGTSSPPHDSHDEGDEIHALPSDEDHDHDHGDHDLDHDDLDHDQSHPPESPVQAEELKKRIIKQAEYYFSDENLPTDRYMIRLLRKNKEGFVPISTIVSFRKMKKLTRDHMFIVAALRESSFLVLSSDGKKVKRLHPFPMTEVKDPKVCTVLVENLPEDHSVENIQRIFSVAGRIRHISIHNPQTGKDSKKGGKVESLISSKLHALVEYDTVETAEKAVASLNNEQDWRNGMHVKLLMRVLKHRYKKQGQKESNQEKNSNSHVSSQKGNEEIHNQAGYHEDTHEEEDVERASKDKNGHHARNCGRSRKNKYHGSNGLGHGTTMLGHGTGHGAEYHSKPPPGPKMPDGTRGFTMGRGRPPAQNQG